MGFISAAAYSLWSLLLRVNPVSRVSVFGFMNPVFGVILSAILLAEGAVIEPWRAVAALVLISVGILVVLLQVTDDGVGGAALDAGSGLLGLEDRVAALGGKLRLPSTAGVGTTLVAEMPLKETTAASTDGS